jgi:pyridinium-3,5-bisthiocarboxylic acid mononucleotide nickel chelatase
MSRRSSIGSSKRRGDAQKADRAAGRVLHLDCFSGIAGNMFLGALLDAGLSREELESDLAGLGLEYELVVKRVRRGALAANYVDVHVPGHHHDHHHHDHEHGRSYREIAAVLEKARLEPGVRERALGCFEALARAEARVHGTAIAKVHFHEVGAVDAIVDLTGAAIGLARLGITRVTASPPALGTGSIETEHGILPVPSPATLELLRGLPTVPAHVEWETVTPTGAALLRTLVDEFGDMPAMTIEAIGHGAGNDRKHGLPNVLRAVIGRASGAGADRVACLETNLDDLVPEHFEFLMERLFGAGALDVSLQTIQMKKNRPGVLVRVLARPSDKLAVAHRLFAESTAIGVRVFEVDRVVLHREMRRVETRYGRIAVKVVTDLEGRETFSAEVDDCVRAARKHDTPLREVVRVAEEAARR